MEKGNRKKWIIMGVALIIFTNLITFFVTNSLSFVIGNRVILNTDSQETAQGLTKLLSLKETIGKDFYKEVSDSTLMEGAIKGMFDSLEDPYSAYFTPEEFKSYMEMVSGEYEGIGIVVSQDDQGSTYVIAPYKGTPAEVAGIQIGDKILKVDGEDVSILGSDEVVKRVKGPANTQVSLTIGRGEETLDFNITRQAISVETVESKKIGDLGYIQITEFTNNTSAKFKEQLDALINQNIKGLIIDLRGNPGGSVPEAVAIADRLLGETTVVYTLEKNGERTEYSSDDLLKVDIPVAVLVDGGSASSSEILAGALQDTKVGTLIGVKTYGKGIVQEIRGIGDGAGFKVTNSEYFTPNGRNIHGEGLEPDLLVEPSEFMLNNPFADEEDIQLQKAIEFLNQK
ncbi:MAG: S41 family peptidase [Eubacteriaceae bacterium]